MKNLLLFCSLSLFVFLQSQAQETGLLSGKILSPNQEAIPETYIYVQGSSLYTRSDDTGTYQLQLEPGKHELVVVAMGYLKQKHVVTIDGGERITMDFSLEPDPDMALNEVSLQGKSALKEVQETSYNVVALDTRPLHNTTLDISQALERVSGVRVRRNGGVGSDYNVMLNGFTGRHVKYFIDGVPMEGFSSAFQLNNLPINLAKRIEVYKGVVPINFGSDALGGAINIVTEDKKQNFLNLSYSYGSFNTHKSFLNGAYTSDSGFTARLTAFQNYSDNDYQVKADIVDLETSQFTGDIRRVRRFHDRYRNYTVIGKLGLVNKSFADQLLLGLTYGDEYNEIQHPAYMKIAFGEKFMTSETLMPSLIYQKKNLFTSNLDVSLTANYNFGAASSIDDSYRRYNWLGQYIETDAPGEFAYTRNFLKNRNGAVNTNLTYKIKDKHAITLNNVLNTFSRKNRDEVEPSPVDAFPRETIKDLLGVGYKFQPNDDLSASFFYKYYFNKVKHYADPTSSGTYQNMGKVTQNHGYGFAASYFLLEDLQVKTSFEKAYRLPTGRELFGAGNDFELGNPDLKAESSNNFNFGLHYQWQLASNHVFVADGSFIYRDIKDFIRQIPNPSDGVLQPGNEASVKNRGVDLELRYDYGTFLSIGSSMTYQNLRNKLKYRSGKDVVSTIYNDRIPNMPYLYGNGEITFHFGNVWQQKDRLNMSYGVQYIHEFDYSYESYSGIKIPTQVSHDIFLNYSLNDGKYSISFEVRNILDQDLYDNFSLQKPGRSFAIKLNYFLDHFN